MRTFEEMTLPLVEQSACECAAQARRLIQEFEALYAYGEKRRDQAQQRRRTLRLHQHTLSVVQERFPGEPTALQCGNPFLILSMCSARECS